MASTGKKIIVVFGATGSQGGSVIKSILGDSKAASQFQIRAVTRDTSKPSAKALADQGCELVTVCFPSLSLSALLSIIEFMLTCGRRI
jgi:uncharacterized protein YbjT (DUF2867 family)